MIKEKINASIGSYTLDGEVIIPSAVLTSTTQVEELDLSKNPNIVMKLNDSYNYLSGMDEVEVSTYIGSYFCTMNAEIINRAGKSVTLQYVDGMTTSYVEPEPPEPTHTLEFSPAGPFSCSVVWPAGDTQFDSEQFNVLYDGNAIDLGGEFIPGVELSPLTYCELSYQYPRSSGEITGLPEYYSFQTNYTGGTGTFEDVLTVSYMGLTTSCNINVEVQAIEQHELSLSNDSFSCSIDNYTFEETPSDTVIIYYDGTPAEVMFVTVEGTTNCQFNPVTGYSGQFMSGFGLPVGTYEDTVTFTYEGISATCTVHITVTDSTPVPTLSFEQSNYSTSRDNYTNTSVQSARVEVLYSGTEIELRASMFSGMNHCTFEPITGHGGLFRAATGLTVGTYTDTVVCSYEGLTAQCEVTVTITDSTPVIHTLEFSPAGPFSCSYDNYTGERHMSDSVWLLYDNSYVSSPRQYITNNAGANAYTLSIPTSDRINFAVDYSKNPEAGEYNEFYTASYMGLTATCYVTGYVTDSNPNPQPDAQLSNEISNILGTEYEVINDMTEQDAIDAANQILYGEQN